MPTVNYTSLIQQAITQYSNDGVGLYNALKSIHTQAKAAGDSVTYPFGETLHITVCLDNNNDPQEIPLSPDTNFNACRFYVTNTTNKTVNLFSLTPSTAPQSVNVDKSLLRKDATVYGSNQELNSSPKLLIVEDQSLWTNRLEYDESGVLVTTPFKRKDIFFVTGNVVQNDPIATYDNIYSSPTCQYIDVSTEQKLFRFLIFERTSDSNAVTNLVSIRNQYNVLIDTVIIRTPAQPDDNGIYHDNCIAIMDSAKVEMNSIVIDHTYSAIYHYGYGIRLNNVWDCSISILTANSPARGVMASEHLNQLTVRNSVLNRVDVHCYGRDITCTNCTFLNTTNTFHVYNRVSSFYGKLTYNNCTFDHFLPLRIDAAYNAFTPFDVILDNCTLYVTAAHKSLVNTDNLRSDVNPRYELQNKCLPNIIITNLSLNIPSSDTEFCFLRISNNHYTGSFHYMNTFIVDVIEFTHEGTLPVTISDINIPITLVEHLRRNINMTQNIISGT